MTTTWTIPMYSKMISISVPYVLSESSLVPNISYITPLPHACLSHVTAISSSPLNWQSKGLISVKVASSMLLLTQIHHFILLQLLAQLKTNHILIWHVSYVVGHRATSGPISVWACARRKEAKWATRKDDKRSRTHCSNQAWSTHDRNEESRIVQIQFIYLISVWKKL